MSEQKELKEDLEVRSEESEDILKREDVEVVETVEEEEKENENTLLSKMDEEVSSGTDADNIETGALEVKGEGEENEEDIDAQIANLNKHDAAVLLIKKAKHIVQDAETQMEACKLLLSDDLQEFENAKKSLKEGGMDESEAFLTQLGYDKEEEEKAETVVFEAKEEVAPIYVREVSSGKFTSFLLALIVGAVTFTGLVFLAAQKLGITIDVKKVPTMETCNSIMQWFASQVSVSDPRVGGALIAVIVLLVMWIVYKIRVSIKAGNNLQFAKEQLQKAQEYAALKGTCKDEMDKIDAHIKEAVRIMKTYEVIFYEQKGKLRRIQYLEQEGKESPQYHEKSLKEMENTYDLISTIKDFLNTPMAEEGKLSGKSTLFLYRAKNSVERMIERFY